jgi:hypothetical protein
VEKNCSRETPCRKGSCRLCLPCGLMVADVVAAYPEGLSEETVAALMGVSQQITNAHKLQGIRKLKARMSVV